ncbi:hypothetical protein ACKWTF_009260 [Chironomus riparius]
MGKSKKREYSSDSSEEEERIKRNKKHKKKSKKSKHKKSKKHSGSSESESEEEWVVKTVDEQKKSPEMPSKRDDWMSADNFFIPTFTREKADKKVAPEKQKGDTYDPATSSRELNPYFKTGEGGLPSFQRPKDNDDDYYSRSSRNIQPAVKQNWKKSQQPDARKISRSPSRSPSPPIQLKPDKPVEIEVNQLLTPSDFLTDEQMNSIGAKMLKAEMMGKTKLATELKEKLEKAKEYRKNNPKGSRPRQTEDDNKVVLSLPTASGMNRPIKQSDVRDSRHSDKKQKKKRVETHEGGERTRYYPDDDKYDIKTLFEREKYSDGRDQDLEFAKAISKVKDSQQMDMADIFSDTIRKDKQPKSDERDEAIREAKRLEKVLESCYKCFDSPKMNKDLIVHVGKHIYVAIPYHERLVNHHLIISPIQHTACTTMIDEEVWEEFRNYKKALTRFFLDKKEDVVFFETVKYLHRRPHMEVQMISSKDFELIQFYFKKAIQESEKLTMNKKLIDIKGDKNIRSSIPRAMPYFWIDFGNSGMAHVIEDQESFPLNFAQEVIGGMLNLDVRKFRKPRKEYDPAKNVKYFSTLLKNVFENL